MGSEFRTASFKSYFYLLGETVRVFGHVTQTKSQFYRLEIEDNNATYHTGSLQA